MNAKETGVAGLVLGTGKSVYVDPHLEDNTTKLVVDVIDSHDMQYAGTRNKHVS